MPGEPTASGSPAVSDSATSETTAPTSFSPPRQITGIMIASLIVLLLFRLAGVLVVLAGVFAFLDAWQAGIRKRKDSQSFVNISPMGWGIAFMGLLIVSYPLYFFSRNRLKTTSGNTAFWVLTNCFSLLVILLLAILMRAIHLRTAHWLIRSTQFKRQ